MFMKNHCTFIAALALCAGSCAAQPAAKPTVPPKAAAATPDAQPPKPARPTPPDDAILQEHAAKQIKAAADQMAKAQMQFSMAEPFGENDDANHTLILPRDGEQPKNAPELAEDLNVMARILEKSSTSHDERAARAMGIFYRSPFGSSGANVRNLYLDGYGAIFFLNVSYSLTPPPTKPEEIPVAKEDKDIEWENARRELEEPRGSRSDFRLEPKAQTASPGAPGVLPYDAERVETLQKDLAQALKNAVHIRDLKPAEIVTVVVTGRGASGNKKIPTRMRRLPSGESVDLNQAIHQRLVIRAKKSDIDDFKNEKLSLDEFRKRISVSLT